MGGRFAHPDELLRHLTWEQFVGWMAFEQLEPSGELRADMRQVAMVGWLAAMLGGSDPPNVTWPYFEGDDSGLDLDDLAAAREAHRKAYGYN